MFRVPVNSNPNQSLFFTAEINRKNMNIELRLRYINDTYWVMDILNRDTREFYLTNIPLVPAEDPAQNILEAYDSMWIGNAYIVPTDNITVDGPTGDDLGTSWALVWDNNYDVPDPTGKNTEVILVWEAP